MSADDTLTSAPSAIRFSPTDAAFAGFSLIRRQPLAILEWAVMRLLVNLALGAAMVLLAADTIEQFTAMTAPGSNASAGEIGAAFAGLLPFLLVVVPINLGMMAVIYAAGYRAFLRPRERGFGYLRLGQDELRLAIVTVLWALLFSLLVFVATFVFLLLLAFADSIGGGLATLLGVLAVVAFITVVVWSLVRMSLSWAVSFDQKRISLFSTWRLTKGHFWSVLGAYFLATVLMIVVSLAAMAIFYAIVMLVSVGAGGGLGSIGQLKNTDASSLASYFTPGLVVYLAFEAVVSAAGYAIMLGPTAEAYLVFGKARHAGDDEPAALSA